MKKLNLFLFITSAVLVNFLVSCSSKKIGFFNNSYPQYVHKQRPQEPAEAAIQKIAMPIIVEKPFIEKYAANDETKETGEEIGLNKLKPKRLVKVSKSETIASEKALAPVKKLTKQEKKQIRQTIKKENTNRTGIGTLLLVIIAIILPPLAVGLVDGLRGPFWLDLLLTILFYIPGLIYALWRVFREED